MVQDYPAALEYLYALLPSFQRIGNPAYKAGLENTIALCNWLGNPQNSFPSIHVAGTNGKGSTSHMLAAILQSAGYKVGLYTSPHLKEFTERFRVNGKEISQDRVLAFVQKMQQEGLPVEPSFFELSVAMAFEFFKDEKVDIAVIETGLGGRLDSTNIITPVLSVITNISWDHADLLGNSLAKIAGEKAGIIKPRVPALVGRYQPDLHHIFVEKAAETGAPLFVAENMVQVGEGEDGAMVISHPDSEFLEVFPELKGGYQKENIETVVAACILLQQLGYDRIDDYAIVNGIERVVRLTGLKGRWQILRQKPIMVADTAHNEDGLRAVFEQVQKERKGRLYVIIGMVKEKDTKKVLPLLPKKAEYLVTQPSVFRAKPKEELLAELKAARLNATLVEGDVNEALAQALAKARPEDMIVVTGSTFLVADLNSLN